MKNNKLRDAVNFITGMLFTLYTAYHVYLLAAKNTNIPFRIICIAIFLFISVAMFFALIPRPVIRLIGTILLIAGLALNFVIKLFNARIIFKSLDFSSRPSILNCAVFVLSEIAIFILLIYFLIFRRNLSDNRRLTVILMSVVIALYVLCLMMECVLLLRYNLNVDLSLAATTASRFIYCLAFVGLAVNFLLPFSNREKKVLGIEEDPSLGKFDEDYIF